MTGRFGYFSLTIRTVRRTFSECPCAESITITSTFAFTSASTRSRQFAVIPIAAPQRSLPWPSFADSGYLICFSMSLIVIRPFKFPSLSTIGSFSFLAFARIFFASSSVIPSGAVISPSEVMDSFIFLEKSSSNFKSRFVIIPTSFFPSVIGTPEILNFAIRSLASASVWSGESENGSVITPFSDLFTLSTSSACCSIVMFLWMIPIPPWRAMAIAMRCSVTVSIPALIIGMFSLIVFVRYVDKSTWFGMTCEYAGTNRTSSNVIPSPIIFPMIYFLSFSNMYVHRLSVMVQKFPPLVKPIPTYNLFLSWFILTPIIKQYL